MKCWTPPSMPLERARDPIVFCRTDGVPSGAKSDLVPQGSHQRDAALIIAAEVLSSGAAYHYKCAELQAYRPETGHFCRGSNEAYGEDYLDSREDEEGVLRIG